MKKQADLVRIVMETKEIRLVDSATILALPVQDKRCPDYDESCHCFTPEQAWYCWIGTEVEINGKWYYTEQVRGYCPIAHQG